MDTGIDIIDKLKKLYYTYYEQCMVWYRGLDDLGQFGVLAAAIVVVFFILIVFVLSRVTRR